MTEPRYYVRLLTQHELSAEITQQVVDIVSNHAIIMPITGYDQNHEQFDVEILVYQDPEWGHICEIFLESALDEEQGDRITQDLSSIIQDDFELEANQ